MERMCVPTLTWPGTRRSKILPISATKVFDHFGLAVLVINTITVGLAGAIFPPGPPGGVGLSDKSHHHGRAGVE